MGTEKAADYYDENLKNFLVPYETSNWKPVYDQVVRLVPDHYTGPICDIGCGTGRLAKALQLSDFENYTGLDFSNERIKEARRYMPDTEFFVMDVFSGDAKALYQEHRFFVLTEILEHLEQDLELLSALPEGSRVIASVPNFDSPAHVRIFDGPDAVIERYGSTIDFGISDIHTVKKKTSKSETYIFHGVKS